MRHTPLGVAVGWLPRGLVSTDSLKQIVRRAVPDGWVDHPSFWAVACDYSTGRRVPFGREGIDGRADAPPAELPDAVAASCAIPGFYRPVRIGKPRLRGRRRALRLEPRPAGRAGPRPGDLHEPHLHARAGAAALNVLDRVAHATRQASGRRLGYEAKRVRALGTDTVLIQPVADDLVAMGRNLMSGARRNEVIETAQGTVREQLRDPATRKKLSGLPAGEPHKIRMPDGPPSRAGRTSRPAARRAA